MEVAFLCQKLQLKKSSVSETCGSKVALEPETPRVLVLFYIQVFPIGRIHFSTYRTGKYTYNISFLIIYSDVETSVH